MITYRIKSFQKKRGVYSTRRKKETQRRITCALKVKIGNTKLLFMRYVYMYMWKTAFHCLMEVYSKPTRKKAVSLFTALRVPVRHIPHACTLTHTHMHTHMHTHIHAHTHAHTHTRTHTCTHTYTHTHTCTHSVPITTGCY